MNCGHNKNDWEPQPLVILFLNDSYFLALLTFLVSSFAFLGALATGFLAAGFLAAGFLAGLASATTSKTGDSSTFPWFLCRGIHKIPDIYKITYPSDIDP